ncbi:uncharacterized protein LOC141900888 [Tubulanus polymorphus]|uniref:uncharacterized protein LOC141900888 n=1 Tax=Tubulanus polymorphus TaxID=672921 RepID=UPI003DA26298
MAGRGPSLRSIGKVHSVETENPPLTSSLSRDEDILQISTFDPEIARETTKSMQKILRICNPGNHVCLRNQGGSDFLHCRRSIRLGKNYLELRNLVQKRSRLELIRDYCCRIQSLAAFIKELQGLVAEEYVTWQKVTASCTDAEIGKSNLEHLRPICEDLRLQIFHWNSVKQHLHRDVWLGAKLATLGHEMEFVRITFERMVHTALWWTSRLVQLGVDIFAHIDMSRLSQTQIWNVMRGMEELNSILGFIKSNHIHPYESSDLQSSLSKKIELPKDFIAYKFHAQQSNDLAYIMHPNNLKSITFSKLLHSIAETHARFVADTAYRFFFHNDEFLTLLKSSKIHDYSWSVFSKSDSALSTTQQPQLQHQVPSDTSDYHSCTGSRTSLSDTFLKVGDLRAPDLSMQSGPLLEFMAKETEFTVQFLNIVFQSTNHLVKKGNPLTAHGRVHAERPFNKSKSTVPTSSSSQTTAVPPPGPKRRKTVSWGDNADSNVKAHLVQRYWDMLWHSFGNHLQDMLFSHSWGPVDFTEKMFGNIDYCQATVIIMAVQMVKQVSYKDLFPAACIPHLLVVAKRMQAHAAFTAWDIGIGECLASSVVDHCYPTPLVNAEFCTKTGKKLRDSFQPMSMSLQMIQQCIDDATDRGASVGKVMISRMIQLPLLLPVMLRILKSSENALQWCTNKSHGFLSTHSIGPFLLITQSDLKFLSDEVSTAVHMTQNLCDSKGSRLVHVDSLMQTELRDVWQDLSDLSGSLQRLSGACMKQLSEEISDTATEFFSDAMPTGKIWRQKNNQEFPTEANEYVRHGLNAILEPVIAGAEKLKVTSQLGVISVAVSKMCEAWTDFILKERIRFSLHGACQLKIDFDYVISWLDSYIENTEVKQSVLSLDVFKYLDGITQLLMKQPPRIGKMTEEKATDYSPSTITEQSSISQTSDVASNKMDDLDTSSCLVKNVDDWLSLRVQGGSRSWKIATCFNAS